MSSDCKQKIQNIFNDTITQIIEVTKKSITSTTQSVSGSNNVPSSTPPEMNQPSEIKPDTVKQNTITPDIVKHEVVVSPNLASDLVPVLQTFIQNIQIYHTQMFNSVVNSVSALVPTQSVLSHDIQQPSVTNKWTHDTDPQTGPGLLTSNSSMSGFVNINDTDPIWPMQRERVSDYIAQRPPSYSVASQETRRHWGSRSPISAKYSTSSSKNQGNYDDFLKHYTSQYENYNTTYVQDSSDEENEEAWKSLDEYVKEMSPSVDSNKVTENINPITEKSKLYDTEQNSNTYYEGMQCCARLSKYMKYHIIDYPEDFLDSYPPDVYIENGNVFGKPCSNRVSEEMEAAGIHFCDEHKYDIAVEDIRQPRASHLTNTTNIPNSSNSNDDVEIEFRNDGYSAAGFDYYGNHSTTTSTDFENGIQCCARLNKFRKYRIELEPSNFLNTYPPNVYIEDGCVYGSACQNIISDESASAGIIYCIQHQSDPYVENICEPSGVLNRPITHTAVAATTTTKNDDIDLIGLNEFKFDNPPARRQSSRLLNKANKQVWNFEKSNTNFDELR